MSDATLSIPFAPPSAADATEDLVLLEQKEWAKRTGLLTRAGMVRWLDAVLYRQGNGASGLMDCGLNAGGDLEIILYAYPLRPGVRFRLVTTIGQLVGGDYEEIEESESVSLDMTAEASINHPALRIRSASWLVGPYNPDGNPIPAPPLWTDGRRIIAPRPMYGSVHLTLIVPRYTWRLVLPWAEAAALVMAGWSEFAVCLPPPGRPVALALNTPPGFEELVESGEDCGSARTTITHKDGDWPPECPPADKTVKCDYCALECERSEE